MTLDEIFLAPAVIEAWRMACRKVVLEHKLRPQDCPDEQVQELPDGTLEIFVELPVGRLSLIVPPDAWVRVDGQGETGH